MEMQSFCGPYYMMGFLLEVRLEESNLAAAVPGVPEGFEIRLEPLGGAVFRMRGGPVDGSSGEFLRDEAGRVTAFKVGGFELARISPEQAAGLPFIERMTAPPFDLPAEKQAAFQGLLDAILANPDGGKIAYDLPYPKHEFARYVETREACIFHGSNNRAIAEFAPVRKSVELEDRRGFGNLQAVYGTHDPLWAMFFAVVDRARLRGSIRNGVMYMHNRAGERLAVYNFSVNQEQLAERPWTSGALYLLPREPFARQKFTEESYSNEWASVTPVKPLARLDLDPEDFPFLERIAGHDDGVFLRAETLGKTVRAAALSASLEGARLQVTLPPTPELAQALAELVEIQRVMIPAARFLTEETPGGLRLTIDDLPAAYRQVYAETYQDLLG